MTPTLPRSGPRPLLVGACLAAIVLAVAACSGTPPVSPSASAGAGRAQTIHVLEHPTTVTLVRVGSLTGCTSTPCLGDYYAGNSNMFDATTNTKVGTFLFECFVVDVASGLFHCPANTLDLTGRGQIVYTENVYIGNKAAPAGPWPIIGGTGEFLGAIGTVSSPPDSTASDGDFVITISG
jgi:hypothetical protein